MWSQKLYIFQNKITDFNHFMLSGSLTIVPIFVCSWRSDTTAFAFRWTLPLSSSSNFTVGATSFCRASEVRKKKKWEKQECRKCGFDRYTLLLSQPSRCYKSNTMSKIATEYNRTWPTHRVCTKSVVWIGVLRYRYIYTHIVINVQIKYNEFQTNK